MVPYLQPGVRHEAFLTFVTTDAVAYKSGVLISLYVQFEYPTISSVVSSAASLPVIAPGQVVSIYGTHLSTPPIVAQPGADGLYPTALGNSVVTFNGIPASILYVSNNQINCIVPSRVGRDSTAQVVVARVRGGNTVTPTPAFTIPVQGTSPEIFTVNPNGKGPVAAYNIGSTGVAISTNDPANPVPVGLGISFFSSGAGLWDTSMFNDPIDDAAVPLISMPPKAPVSVTIGGQAAKVTYARSADGKIGILQVNAIVPEGVSAGEQPIVLKIGENDNSSQKATLFVK